MTAAYDPPAPSDVDDATAGLEAIEDAEREARELHRAALLEQVPFGFTLDENDQLIPAEGFQICPACRGQMIIPVGFPLSPKLMPCPSCDGWGSVSTGSRIAEAQNITCDDCQGNGYVDRVNWAATHPEWVNERAEPNEET